MDDSVYRHKRTLQCVRLGKVLPNSRVRPRAKRRAVISFANGAAAEASNCKCKITLRSGKAGGVRVCVCVREGATTHKSHLEMRHRAVGGSWSSEEQLLSGCPRLTLLLGCCSGDSV